jgi:hypothetical protein
MKNLNQVDAGLSVAHVDKSVVGGCAVSVGPVRCGSRGDGGFYGGLRYNVSDARKLLKHPAGR